MVKYIFSVEGMMCCNCEKHAVESVKNAVKGAKVIASHQDKTVEVTADYIDENAVILAIEDRGYTVKGVIKQEVEKKGLFSFLKR